MVLARSKKGRATTPFGPKAYLETAPRSVLPFKRYTRRGRRKCISLNPSERARRRIRRALEHIQSEHALTKRPLYLPRRQKLDAPSTGHPEARAGFRISRHTRGPADKFELPETPKRKLPVRQQRLAHKRAKATEVFGGTSPGCSILLGHGPDYISPCHTHLLVSLCYRRSAVRLQTPMPICPAYEKKLAQLLSNR